MNFANFAKFAKLGVKSFAFREILKTQKISNTTWVKTQTCILDTFLEKFSIFEARKLGSSVANLLLFQNFAKCERFYR